MSRLRHNHFSVLNYLWQCFLLVWSHHVSKSNHKPRDDSQIRIHLVNIILKFLCCWITHIIGDEVSILGVHKPNHNRGVFSIPGSICWVLPCWCLLLAGQITYFHLSTNIHHHGQRPTQEVDAINTDGCDLDWVWLVIGGLGRSNFCFKHGEQKQWRD